MFNSKCDTVEAQNIEEKKGCDGRFGFSKSGVVCRFMRYFSHFEVELGAL
jgi:hypothetical protein